MRGATTPCGSRLPRGRSRDVYKRQILVYGAGGVWLTDAHGQRFADYTAGMGSGADARTIRNVAVSYTHLDVYKRQIPSAIFSMTEKVR